MPPSPGGVLGTDTGLSSPSEDPGASVEMSSSSQMEGLNKSCVNTPGAGGSRLDPSWARALATSLSCWRI
jgi:hypothetical protein